MRRRVEPVDLGDGVWFQPDDPVVERCVGRDLARLRPHVLLADAEMVVVTPEGFSLLPEYSGTMPTGIADGKVFKRDRWYANRSSERILPADRWLIVEYVDEGEQGVVTNRYRRLVVADS